jgi:YD repeat-containing protein
MGRMTQKEYVTANTYRTQTLFEYDDEAHSVKKQFSAGYVGEPLRVDTVTVSTYNEGGYLTKREIEHADGSSYLYEFFYDENGNQIKEHYKASDKNEYLHLWQYDEYGNKTHHSYESTTAWVTPYQEAWEYEYDAVGNVIKKTYTDSRYEGQDVSTYRYDEWGNILKETHPGESDSPNDYREVLYAGYKLYYNPYPVYELPEEFFGK